MVTQTRKKPALSHQLYVNLSAQDRAVLEQIAEDRGATLSGTIRRLIRDAADSLTKSKAEGDNGAR